MIAEKQARLQSLPQVLLLYTDQFWLRIVFEIYFLRFSLLMTLKPA
jgi:hypothetical protein